MDKIAANNRITAETAPDKAAAAAVAKRVVAKGRLPAKRYLLKLDLDVRGPDGAAEPNAPKRALDI
jgi:hypothetical protein